VNKTKLSKLSSVLWTISAIIWAVTAIVHITKDRLLLSMAHAICFYFCVLILVILHKD
jgi:hypothetical protein